MFQREIAHDVRSIVRDLSGFLVQWPALSIIALGIALIAADFVVETIREPFTSTEYVSTLVTGGILCLVGAALEAGRFRRLGSAAETGIEALGDRIPAATMAELRRRLRVGGRSEGAAGAR